MKNFGYFRITNIIFWTIIAILFMIAAYNSWSIDGPYTITDFLTSLLFHGGFCFLLGYLTDKILN